MHRSCAAYEIWTARITVADPGSFLRQLRAVMREYNTTIVCLNAGNMAGIRHVEAALDHAIRSFNGGSPIARTLEMETLLYAAGTRQCAEAASAIGIHAGGNRAYVCCCPPRSGIREALESLVHPVDDEAWEIPDAEQRARLCRLFSISMEEIAAAGGAGRLTDLVIERVALVDAFR